MKSRFTRAARAAGGGLAALTLMHILSGCGSRPLHNGRLPFSLAEKPPSASRVKQAVSSNAAAPSRMEKVLNYDASSSSPAGETIGLLRPGDVVAFHMSHREAWTHLRKGGVQKLPYDLFRYGHVAVVVPDDATGELALLQVAMKQAVNTDHGLDYLHGKSWSVHRPPAGSIDKAKLAAFSRIVTRNASDPRKAYDYSGALGLKNAGWRPKSADEIGSEYSCATLVIAALHYSGFELHAVHRGGWFDIVTPRQVVESIGVAEGRASASPAISNRR